MNQAASDERGTEAIQVARCMVCLFSDLVNPKYPNTIRLGNFIWPDGHLPYLTVPKPGLPPNQPDHPLGHGSANVKEKLLRIRRAKHQPSLNSSFPVNSRLAQFHQTEDGKTAIKERKRHL